MDLRNIEEVDEMLRKILAASVFLAVVGFAFTHCGRDVMLSDDERVARYEESVECITIDGGKLCYDKANRCYIRWATTEDGSFIGVTGMKCETDFQGWQHKF